MKKENAQMQALMPMHTRDMQIIMNMIMFVYI